MAVFPATYFTLATRYPRSGERITLGKSYQFDVQSFFPDQRTFILNLQGMAYFLNLSGQMDLAKEPGRNLQVLENFYQQHRLSQSFTFNHPTLGAIECKFNNPLEIPAGIRGGNGLVPDFDVELIEIP